jgi:hypothetical protein
MDANPERQVEELKAEIANEHWYVLRIEELRAEVSILKVKVETLEKLTRPAPDPWMYNCKAFKCGCEGNPQWHADKVEGERKRQEAARASRNS